MNLKIYAQPPSHHSQAMFRVTKALKQYAPSHITFVDDPQIADLRVIHAIGIDALLEADRPYVAIQYCEQSAGGTLTDWLPFWKAANFVWSYYDLRRHGSFDFYYAPLGVDPVFKPSRHVIKRDVLIMTSGYVTGPGAEAIEEPAIAAARLKWPVLHLGPSSVQGWLGHYYGGWQALTNINDQDLCTYYHHCWYVSGLRHCEGFELPVIEGVMCGCRPLVFDRPETRHWFSGFAEFIPECSGGELINRLEQIFRNRPSSITRHEFEVIERSFNWERIVSAFWRQL